MTYRDEQQAALSRAEALQHEVEAARKELGQLRVEQEEAAQLKSKLAAAESKLATLQGRRPPRPASFIVIVSVLLIAGAGAVLLLLTDSSKAPSPVAPVVAGAPVVASAPVGISGLARVGLGASSIARLRGLAVTQPEIGAIAQLKRAGASDDTCVELIVTARARGRRLTHGSAAAAMLRAGVSQPTLLALAQLNQLGWQSDVVAMRQAGVADPTVLLLARMRSLLQLSVSGQDVSRLRQAGVADDTIVALATKGLRPDQISELIAQRQAGLSDAKILTRFKPSKRSPAAR